MTVLDASAMLAMSQAELDDLFRASPAGGIPVGEAHGKVLIAPGTEISQTIASFLHIFAWKGKVFDPQTGTLKNIILPMGEKAVIARVYKEASWFDGQECIVLDYSQTSLIAHWVRDEIRLVAPGTYLGIVFWEKAKLINFTLTFAVAA
jgi:hypothetical protein